VVPVRPVNTTAAVFATVETDRLILQPVDERHRADLIAFLGTPEVMSVRKLGVLDAAAASAVVDDMIVHWREHGFGMYAVIERDSGAFLGECGLRFLADGTVPEISYGLHTSGRGKGYAREASVATMGHGFGPLGLRRIVAFARGDNVISRTLLESLGFSLVWEREKGDYSVVHYEALAPAGP